MLAAAGNMASQAWSKRNALSVPGQNPTLLTSRSACPVDLKECPKPQVALSIAIPEPDEFPGDEHFDDQIRVRNTFIEIGQPSSLERFYSDRIVRSCPGSQVGCLRDVFEEPAGEELAPQKRVLQLAEVLAVSETQASAGFMGVPPPVPPAPPAPPVQIMPAGHVRCPPPPPPPARATRTPLSSAATLFTPGAMPQHGGVERDQQHQQQLCPAVAELMNSVKTAECNASWDSQSSMPPRGVSPMMAAVHISPAAESQPGVPYMMQVAHISLATEAQPGLLADSSLEGLPSVGSAGHAAGNCKPCAFFHTKGCGSGASCSFCHLCGPGEKKRRQKEKKQAFKSAAASEAGEAHL
eukprot:TRINITY_DN9994_c0_g1_i1.p1 TRINITY_DN9994_c0_g1~~TRINITY_DN9994_c0_g1_i1.p1  ORF type:complete len:353 (-),score=89.19 TRINITY_DN9994_c0_g1_i1:114-1172(-)